jgi:negative regulator of sigma E activity
MNKSTRGRKKENKKSRIKKGRNLLKMSTVRTVAATLTATVTNGVKIINCQDRK